MGTDPNDPIDSEDDPLDDDNSMNDDDRLDEDDPLDDDDGLEVETGGFTDSEDEFTDPEEELARERSTVVGTETGLEENVAGALSYLLGPLTGILFYVLEDENPFVRFHAAQSTILFGGLFVVGIGLSMATAVFAIIPVLGWLISAVLGLVGLVLMGLGFVLWLFLMYNAYTGGEYEVPVAGPYARRYAPQEADPLEAEF